MDCKKVLVEVDGDMDKAIEELRKRGVAKADKKSSRTAADGIVICRVSDDRKTAMILEINSETDFVAKDENFMNFANIAADIALESGVQTIEELANTKIDGGLTIEQARQELVQKIGENIQLRRLTVLNSNGEVGAYIHGNKIGVLVSLDKEHETLAKDIAMHIAASNPIVVEKDQVPAEVVEKEKSIFIAQAEQSGKPAEIIEKMITGRINKFLDEVSLVGQAFVKDPNLTVGKLLKEHDMAVTDFIRYQVGEGIEVEQSNFADEVMAQVKESS